MKKFKFFIFSLFFIFNLVACDTNNIAEQNNDLEKDEIIDNTTKQGIENEIGDITQTDRQDGKGIDVIVDLKTNQDDNYQLFYDTGSGFSEENSIVLDVKSSEDYQNIVYNIPTKDIIKLRIDLGTKENDIAINSINIKYKENEKILKGEAIKELFTNLNQLEYTKVENDILFLKSTGSDPQMSTNDISNIVDELAK